MSDENKILDLDELFGQARAVKIKWQGKEYELMRLEAISPKQSVAFNKLHLESARLQKKLNGKSEISDDEALQVEDLIDQMLLTICPSFPVAEIPFGYKSRCVQFYMEQNQSKKAAETDLKKLTGQRSSRK